jgi:hypothetical protein
MDQQLRQMESNSIISRIKFTQWGSQLTPVPKPDGSTRLCGNYVRLEKITEAIQYPYVNMHLALRSLGKASVFSKLDLASGYYQIPILESDKEKTALATTNGTYIFNVMPFGLKNVPATFQELMHQVLGSHRYTCAIAYLDDIIIYSTSRQQHLTHLKLVLQQLRSANLSLNIKKCSFGLERVDYLDFIITAQGLRAIPDKVKPILKYTAPTTIEELDRFLGLTGVY